MKSFFAAAAVAAIALAYEECDEDGKCWWVDEPDVKGDIEDALDDIADFFEDLQEFDPEEAKEEANREVEREIEKALEDLECWWADRNGGDGQCAKREREEAMYACWDQHGMEWDWDTQ